jgi:hypothetical protein
MSSDLKIAGGQRLPTRVPALDETMGGELPVGYSLLEVGRPVQENRHRNPVSGRRRISVRPASLPHEKKNRISCSAIVLMKW